MSLVLHEGVTDNIFAQLSRGGTRHSKSCQGHGFQRDVVYLQRRHFPAAPQYSHFDRCWHAARIALTSSYVEPHAVASANLARIWLPAGLVLRGCLVTRSGKGTLWFLCIRLDLSWWRWAFWQVWQRQRRLLWGRENHDDLKLAKAQTTSRQRFLFSHNLCNLRIDGHPPT